MIELTEQDYKTAQQQTTAMLKDAKLTTTLLTHQLIYINKKLDKIRGSKEPNKQQETPTNNNMAIADNPATSDDLKK